MIIRISKNTATTLRTAYITMFIIFCVISAFVLIGKAYSVIELTAFGNNTEAFLFTDKNNISVFGHKIYFPFITVAEEIIGFLTKYSSGIIKFLNSAYSTVEEAVKVGFGYILSSFK